MTKDSRDELPDLGESEPPSPDHDATRVVRASEELLASLKVRAPGSDAALEHEAVDVDMTDDEPAPIVVAPRGPEGDLTHDRAPVSAVAPPDERRGVWYVVLFVLVAVAAGAATLAACRLFNAPCVR